MCDVNVWTVLGRNNNNGSNNGNGATTTNANGNGNANANANANNGNGNENEQLQQIKWCKGCKNFKLWASFGDKGHATKCLGCRERQKEKYALQKAARNMSTMGSIVL